MSTHYSRFEAQHEVDITSDETDLVLTVNTERKTLTIYDPETDEDLVLDFDLNALYPQQ